MTTHHPSNPTLLEALARHCGKPLHSVQDLYDEEYAALAEEARITSFISLLALRRVRSRLRPVHPQAVH